MEKKQYIGTKDTPDLDQVLDRNQEDLVDELTTPHSYVMPEKKGARHQIVSKVPAYNPEAQPVQARGRIVWNNAYRFSPKGPSYLDPTPEDPSSLSQAR